MRKISQTVIVAFGLCFGCSRNNVDSPGQFTREFAEALRQSSPGLKIQIVKDLELNVTKTDGSHFTAFLDNAYDLYSHDPKSKDKIIQEFVAADLDSLVVLDVSHKVDPTRIVPVVKDKLWLEEFEKDRAEHGKKDLPESVYEELNSDLIIIYAEDSPKNIRYLTETNLQETHINRKELRTLACANLERLLPKVKKEGTNNLYILDVGGDYEASLLLLDPVWTDIQKDVHGDIVAAIPTRDVLIVTGSEDSWGLQEMKKLVNQAFEQGSYKLTKQLFVRRNGTFVEFTAESR